MKQKGWMQYDKLKKITKNQILIGGLVGVLLLVIAIPVDNQKKNSENDYTENAQQKNGTVGETEAEQYERKLERRLEEALESMDGVGKVEVMITLKDNGESVVEKDISTGSQSTEEGNGGESRKDNQSQLQEETVFYEREGSGQQPFISREVTPQIEGILVVAEGGGNSVVVKNISDAVLALFPVEVHKIKVVKMNL